MPAPAVVLPTHPPAPREILACAGSRAITGALFTHWSQVARSGEPSHQQLPEGPLVGEVMGFLISSDWVLGEAEAMHIHVSARKVRRTYETIRKRQFRKRKRFRAFLKSSGQTVSDLLFRVKLNLLSGRIEKRTVSRHPSAAGKKRALSQFVQSFKRKWQARTYCSPEYSSSDCGRIQAPPL